MPESAALTAVIDARVDKFNDAMKSVINTTKSTVSAVKAEFAKANPKIDLSNINNPSGGRLLSGVLRDVEQLTGSVPALTQTFTSFGLAGVAAGAAISGAFSAAKEAMNFGAEIEDLSQKMGVTTDEVQKFHYIARATGTDVKAMDDAVVALNRSLGSAAANAPRSLQPFQLLFGKDFKAIDARELLASGNAMSVVAKEFAKLNTAGQTALASKFGFDGIRPFLDEFGKGLEHNRDLIAELGTEAESSGAVLDSAFIQRSAELQHRWDNLTQIIKVDVYEAIFALEPALVWLLGKIQEIAATFGGLASGFQHIEQMDKRQLETNADENRQRIRELEAQGVKPVKPAVMPAETVQEGAATFRKQLGDFAMSAINPFAHLKPAPTPPFGTFDEQGRHVSPLEALPASQNLFVRKANQDRIDRALLAKANQEAADKADFAARATGGANLHELPTRGKHASTRDKSGEQLDRFMEQSAGLEKQMLQARNNEFATLQERADLNQQILEAERKQQDFQIDRAVASGSITKAAGEQLKAQTDALYKEKETVQLKIDQNKLLQDSIRVQQQQVASQLDVINVKGSTLNRSNTDSELENIRSQLLIEQRRALIDAQALQIESDTELTDKQKKQKLQNFIDKLDYDQSKKFFDVQSELLSLKKEELDLQKSFSTSRKERQALDLEMLAIEKRERDQALQDFAQSHPEFTGAQQSQAQATIDLINKQKQRQIIEQNSGPVFQDLQQNLQDLEDIMQNSMVSAIHNLEDSLVDAAFESKNFGDAVRNIFRDIGKDLLRSVLRENITIPLEKMLTHGTQSQIAALGNTSGATDLKLLTKPTGALGSPIHVLVDNQTFAGNVAGSGGISDLIDKFSPQRADVQTNIPDLTSTTDIVAKLNSDFSGTFTRDGGNFITQAADVFKSNTDGGFIGGLENVFGSALNGFSGIFSSLGGLLGGGGGGGGLLGGLLGGLGSLFGGGGGAASLFGGGNWLPAGLAFANGTNFAPGGMALVGEKGPEIINIPRGAQVIPNHKIPAYAGGTNFATGGMSLVGENGPELLNLSQGAKITPNNMLGNIIGGGSKPVTFDLRGAVVTEDLLRQMNEISLRNSVMSVQFSRSITKNDLKRQQRRSLG